MGKIVTYRCDSCNEERSQPYAKRKTIVTKIDNTKVVVEIGLNIDLCDKCFNQLFKSVYGGIVNG